LFLRFTFARLFRQAFCDWVPIGEHLTESKSRFYGLSNLVESKGELTPTAGIPL